MSLNVLRPSRLAPLESRRAWRQSVAKSPFPTPSHWPEAGRNSSEIILSAPNYCLNTNCWSALWKRCYVLRVAFNLFLPAYIVQTAISACLLTYKAWQTLQNRVVLNYFKCPQNFSYPSCSSAMMNAVENREALVRLEQAGTYCMPAGRSSITNDVLTAGPNR